MIGVFLACGTTAHAEEGKIYVGGSWVNASIPSPASLSQSFFSDETLGNESPITVTRLVKSFLNDNSNLLHLDRGTKFSLAQSQAGTELQTQRLQKSFHGLPVVGGDAVVHLSLGKVAFASADNTELTQLSLRPQVNGEEARALAFAAYDGKAASTSTPELKVLLVGEGRAREARLVYEITVRDRNQAASDIHFIDAQNGEAVLTSTNVHTLKNRQVLAGLGSEEDFNLDETRWTTLYSDQGCGKPSIVMVAQKGDDRPESCGTAAAKIQASALSAWTNSGLVHQYYESVHGRNSVDGKGKSLRSVVNFGGEGFPNAAWVADRSLMLYGLLDSDQINDFAAPLDVTAHEITHGITSSTANLVYADESGALNESYSDVFGKLVAFQNGRATDWKIGRDLFKDGQRFIRDMENPEVGHTSQYLYRGERCARDNDFCGVHDNSGIPNKAAFLIAKKIGREKLGKIYFLTLTQLLRSSSNFQEAKAQTEAACATLYGKTSQDCKAVTESFTAVGI